MPAGPLQVGGWLEFGKNLSGLERAEKNDSGSGGFSRFFRHRVTLQA